MLKFLRTFAIAVAMLLPFAAGAQETFDFEDNAIPGDWTNNSANPWVVTSTSQGSGHSGTYCIKSGNSGIASSTSQISATFDFADDGSISFLGGIFGEGSSTIYDKCIFEIDGEQQFAYGALGTWATYTYQIAAGTHTFTWKYTKDSSVNPTGDAFFVDDIVVDLGVVPTCIKPSNLTVSDLTAHEATFSWESEVGNYVFEYKPAAASDEEWEVISTSDNTVTIDGLTQNTAYTARVKAICDADDESAYRTINFTTTVSCPAPTALTVTLTPGNGTVATLSWEQTGGMTAWQLCLDNNEEELIDVDENPYTLTDLTPEQTYTAKVRAVGDDEFSSWSSTVTFTPTNAYNITVGDGTSTTYVTPYNSLWGYSFVEQIFLDDEIDIVGDITSIAFNMQSTESQTNQIEVFMKNVTRSSFTSETDFEPVTAGDMVFTGTVTFNPGMTTIVFDEPFAYDGGNLLIAVHEYTSGYSTRYFYYTEATDKVLTYHSDSANPDPYNLGSYSGNKYTSANRSNIQLEYIPMGDDYCYKPANLTISDLTAHEATFTWESEVGDYVFEYKPATATDEEWEVLNVNEETVTLEGLTQNTAYTARVKAVCGDDNESSYRTMNFTTLEVCSQPTELAATDVTATSATLDWVSSSDSYNVRYRQVSAAVGAQGFEAGMAGWTTIDADGDGYTWVLASEIGGVYLVEGADITGTGHNSSTDFIASGSYSNVSGVGALTPDNYLVSPQIELGGSITFWANAQDASYAEEHFGVAVSTTSNTDPEAFTMLQEWTLNADGTGTPGPAGAKDQGEWGQFTVDLSDYEGLGYVAIRHFDCTDWFILNIDDISIEQPGGETSNPWNELTTSETSVEIDDLEPITTYEWQLQAVCDGETGPWSNIQYFTTEPTCPLPSDVTVSEITPHSVVVSWTENGESESWTLAYKTATAEEFTLVEVNENPYTLEGLAAQTAYMVKVSPECEPDGWSANALFTTAISCPAPTGVNVVTVPGNGTMATMTWTEAGEATVWQICLNNDLTALIDVEETATYAFENLTPEETYTAKVRAVCGEADTSQWSSSFTFQPTNKRVIGSGTATNSYLPTTSFYNYSLTQQIYTVAELGEAGVITSLDFYNGGSEKTRNLDIYMVSSDKTSFSGGSDWVPVTEADLVYSGNVTFTANVWTSIEFASPFVYDGVNNVILVVNDNTGSWSSGLSCRVFDATSQAIRVYNDNNSYNPAAPSSYSGTVEAAKNQLRLAVAPLGACVMPTLFTATEVGPTSAVLSWQENSEATAWTVAYRTEAEETFTEVVANDNPFTLENLANETTYILKVRSNCADDEISWSNEITITTLPSCPVPTDIEVDPMPHSAEVSWTGFSDSYILEYAEFTASDTLKYDDGTVATNIGNSTPDNWTWASMYPTEMLEDATTLSAVSFYVTEGYITSDVTINIYAGGTEAPETLLHTQNVSVAAGSGFQTFLLSEPVTIDPTQNLWIALNCEGTYVMASCSANDPNNQWVYYEGEWSAIGDIAPSLDTYGWMIRGLAGDPLEWTAINPATSPQNITNLTPETVYAVRVKGNCGEESSAWSDITTFTTLVSCPAVSNLQASNVSNQDATIEWTPAGEESQWLVVFGDNAGQLVSTPSYTLTGLEAMSAYTIAVRAVCGEGDTSVASTLTFTTDMCDDLVTVSNCGPTNGSGTTSYGPIGYSLYNYSYVQTIIDSADMATMTEGAVITAMGYYPTTTTSSTYYTNMDVYLANVSASNLESAFIVPSESVEFVQVIEGGDFTFEQTGWQMQTFSTPFVWDGHSNVLVAVNRKHGNWSSSTSFSAHTDTVARMRYIYQDAGAYDISNPTGGTASSSTTVGDLRLYSCGAAAPVCHTPTITGTEVTETSITMNFTGDAESYEVVIMEGAWGEPTSGMIPITTTSYTFSGLTPATPYTVGVRAMCEDELTSNWTYQTVTTLELVCPAPTNVVVSDVTITSATVAWTVADEAQTAWEINITGLNYDQTVTAATNPYTLTGLTAGVEYTVKVRAICGEGFSEWSEPATFTTGICEAVSNVLVSNITTSSATVEWTAPEGQTTWQLDYGNQGHPQGTGTVVVVNTNPYTLTNLSEYTPYDVYVRAICEDGVFSEWSTKASFTTLQDGEGIDGVNSDLVNIYPNPASSTVTISGISGEATVTVVDMNGRTVYTEKANESLTIDLTGYARGAYFVRISGEQTMAIRKLIVK